MAMVESETREISGPNIFGIDTLESETFLREYLGLEVEHLLPGLDIAANLLRRGQHEEALRTCSVLVLCDPMEIRFQHGLATCALETEDFPIAALAASAIVAGDPDNPEGYLISGRAFLGMRDFDIAVEDFREAVRLAEQAGDAAMARQAGLLLERALIAREVQVRS